MKQFILLLILLLTHVSVNAQYKKDGTPDMRYKANKSSNIYSAPSSSQPSVRYQDGYTKKDGTSVNGHYKTNPNGTNHDNFSTQGNQNPYTGTQGTKARDYSPDASNYGQGRTIHTGPNGGQYYINSNGNKTYVPKR